MKRITNFFTKKLKAGALQYVLFIAVVIALLLFAFIALSYVQQEFKLKTSNYIKTIQHTNIAIDYATKNNVSLSEPIKLNLFENENEELTILNKPWGIFNAITATATIKKESFTKNALIGTSLIDRSSLFLQDKNQPLVVVGDTRIEGKVLLPKQGLKRGTIAGNSFTGSELVYGTIGLSSIRLPQPSNKAYLKQLCEGDLRLENFETIELVENTTLINSFERPTQIFRSEGEIDLRDIVLTGNIIVQSYTAIKVHKSTTLTDVLLIAPKIEIYDSVKGTFQAFASEEIIVGKNCKLNYPTSLTVYEKRIINTTLNDRRIKFDKIEINEQSEVKGIVTFLSDANDNNYKAQVLVEKDARITGEVYCNGNIELKGTVLGSVFTSGFIANQFGSVYQNHIYNGKILFNDFPEEFSGLLFKDSPKTVAKWLY